MSTPRKLTIYAIVLWGLLAMFTPEFLSPLHTFVPEPYFLRSKSQLGEGAGLKSSHSYTTKKALPYMIAITVIFLVLCGASFSLEIFGLAVFLLAAGPGLSLLTFVRLLLGGGLSGGI
jgi:hypothetical protein